MARAETSSKLPSLRCVLVATRCSRGQTLRDKNSASDAWPRNVIQLQNHSQIPRAKGSQARSVTRRGCPS